MGNDRKRSLCDCIDSNQWWLPYIICSKNHIFTDHNPLTYLTESMSKSAKQVRWSLALQTFDVDAKYTKGKLNVAADCLSKIYKC